MTTPGLRAAITFYCPPEQLSDDSIKRLNEVLTLFDEFAEYAPDCCTGFIRIKPGEFSVSSVRDAPQLTLPIK